MERGFHMMKDGFLVPHHCSEKWCVESCFTHWAVRYGTTDAFSSPQVSEEMYNYGPNKNQRKRDDDSFSRDPELSGTGGSARLLIGLSGSSLWRNCGVTDDSLHHLSCQ